MKLILIISSALMVCTVCLSASTALAEQAALDYVNNESGVSLSCNTCHTTPTGPTLDLMGLAFRAVGGSKVNNYQANVNALGTLDSDGDAISNALEIFAGLDPNTAFLATTAAVDGYTWADQPAAGVIAIASAAMTPADFYTVTGTNLGQGQIVLGGSATQLTLTDTSPVTVAVTQKAHGIVKVHQQQISNLANVSSVFPTVSATGSVTFTPLAVDIYAVIESGEYVPAATASTRAGGDGGGCSTSSITAPLAMTLAMLMLGLLLPRRSEK